MLENRRKFHRFDNSIFLEFRPLKEANEYSLGIARNFSCVGFSFESQNYDIESGEDIEFRLKHPQSELFVSLIGESVWKENSEISCITGIKFKEMDNKTKSKMLEIVSAAVNIYINSFLFGENEDSFISKSGKEKFDEKSSEDTKILGIKKQYLETTPTCKVTFRFPNEAAPEAQKVTIVGDFNGWDKERTLMKKLESGDFTVTLELKSGKEYKFKYLVDENRWENDWGADKYIPSPHGYDDSVVVV
jgi:hypothetical protein